jgi:hypothetical protein
MCTELDIYVLFDKISEIKKEKILQHFDGNKGMVPKVKEISE